MFIFFSRVAGARRIAPDFFFASGIGLAGSPCRRTTGASRYSALLGFSHGSGAGMLKLHLLSTSLLDPLAFQLLDVIRFANFDTAEKAHRFQRTFPPQGMNRIWKCPALQEIVI